MRRVVITGATGSIGTELCRALLVRGDVPVALSRDADRARGSLPLGVEAFTWADPTSTPAPLEALRGADAVINLIGEPIAQRWNDDAKRRIRDSRVKSTKMLVSALRELPIDQRPKTLISQSATGFYGSRGDELLTEQDGPGSDFLAQVVVEWEAAAAPAKDFMRVALTRTGVVLSPSAGALAKMLPFFKLGIGGPVAGGKQFVPWIHEQDVVGGLVFCLDNELVSGPVNLTAPNPVSNGEFSRALGAALHRPALLPVPGAALKLLYGEMAEIVLTGQRARPDVLLGRGFEFKHPQITGALKDALSHE